MRLGAGQQGTRQGQAPPPGERRRSSPHHPPTWPTSSTRTTSRRSTRSTHASPTGQPTSSVAADPAPLVPTADPQDGVQLCQRVQGGHQGAQIHELRRHRRRPWHRPQERGRTARRSYYVATWSTGPWPTAASPTPSRWARSPFCRLSPRSWRRWHKPLSSPTSPSGGCSPTPSSGSGGGDQQ